VCTGVPVICTGIEAVPRGVHAGKLPFNPCIGGGTRATTMVILLTE
jgi:hypothetical protein